MDKTVIVGLIILGLFALSILWLEGAFIKKRFLFVSVIFIAAAMTVRGLCFSHITYDYVDFLAKWVKYFRENGGWSALAGNIGNYNVPYLYFLALFSYDTWFDLYKIKLLSVFFDIILAWGVMRLVYVVKKSPRAVLTAFFLTLFLPTVVLNGSYWGQCDSIYAAFAVFSIYFALDRKPVLSVVFAAVSFSFKLQAVFFLPIFLVFIFTRRVKWRHLVFFPLTYFVMVLPAIITGKPVLETVTLYFNQVGSVGSSLNYNSPSVFSFVTGTVDNSLFSALGIAAAAVFLLVIFIWMYRRRAAVSDRAAAACVLLMCIGIPFFLPHMHDRYFFLADVLSLALAVIVPSMFPVPILVSFASLLGYYAYLRMTYLLPLKYGAAALAAAMLLTAYLLFHECGRGKAPDARGGSAVRKKYQS